MTSKTQRYSRPQSDWIEIQGVTPAIISQELFDAAQKRITANRSRTMLFTKHEYLLRGHMRCRRCGRSFVGHTSINTYKDKRYNRPFYSCRGKRELWAPAERCHNKGWSATKLEGMVWVALEDYLSDPNIIISSLEKQHQDANQLGVFEAELERIERQLKAINREQHQLLQWALKDFPPDQVEVENKRLNKARETLNLQKAEFEKQIKASQNAITNLPNLENFVWTMQDNLSKLDFESKRLALDTLGITVWLDGQNVEVTGTIDLEIKYVGCSNHRDVCSAVYIATRSRKGTL
jgi:site-specific DNA recombinase